MDLSSLTKKDWDTLFPIQLSTYDPDWITIFEAEKQTIKCSFDDKTLLSIEHFGSTSIPGLSAKPYIDMLIEIPKEKLFDEAIINGLTGLGYHYFKQSGNGADYMIFVKGYNPNGPSDQIFHIHMCASDHELWDQILFSNYLSTHPERAKAYEKLKLDLAVIYKNDRSGYRVAKTEFIEETIQLAKTLN